MNDIISPENLVYKKPELLNDTHMHYCAGCSHGVVHKLVAEVIEEMGMQENAIGVSPVGCSVFAYNYIDMTGRKQHTDALQLLLLPSSVCGQSALSSPIRATATWLVSEQPRVSTH